MNNDSKVMIYYSNYQNITQLDKQPHLSQKSHHPVLIRDKQMNQKSQKMDLNFEDSDNAQNISDLAEKNAYSLQQSQVLEVNENQNYQLSCQILENNIHSSDFLKLSKKFIILKNAFNFNDVISVQSQLLQQKGYEKGQEHKSLIQSIQNESYHLSDIFKEFPLHQSLDKIKSHTSSQQKANIEKQTNEITINASIEIIENEKDINCQQKIAQIRQISNESPNQHKNHIQQVNYEDQKQKDLVNQFDLKDKPQKNDKKIFKSKSKLSCRIKKRCKQLRNLRNNNKSVNDNRIQEKMDQIAQNDVQSMEIQQNESRSEDLLHHLGYTISKQTRNIRRANKKARIMRRQVKIIDEFKKSISIVDDRSYDDRDKQYRWEILSKRKWNTLSQALVCNFNIFVKLGRKYKLTFMKHLPNIKKIKNKKQQSKTKSIKKSNKMEKKESQGHLTRKQQRKDFFRPIKKMNNIKQLFNTIQIQKVAQYEQRITQRHQNQIMQFYQESSLDLGTQYEPQSNELDKIVNDFIKQNNEKMKRKYRVERFKIQENNCLPINDIILENIKRIVEQYNYRENIIQFFYITSQKPILSCLEPDSLGLRSKSMKIISKKQFQEEMKKQKQSKQGIVVDQQGSSQKLQNIYQMKIQ